MLVIRSGSWAGSWWRSAAWPQRRPAPGAGAHGRTHAGAPAPRPADPDSSGLPFLGLKLSPLVAVSIAFFLNNAGITARSSGPEIESVPTGSGRRRDRPGCAPTRPSPGSSFPGVAKRPAGLISNTVEVVKLTSLASVVSLQEMLYSADMARSLTFNNSPLVLAALIYIVLLWPVVRLVSRWRTPRRNDRRHPYEHGRVGGLRRNLEFTMPSTRSSIPGCPCRLGPRRGGPAQRGLVEEFFNALALAPTAIPGSPATPTVPARTSPIACSPSMAGPRLLVERDLAANTYVTLPGATGRHRAW